MKKFIAIMLAVLFAMSMAPAAFAATNGNFNVTVKGYYNGSLTTLTTAYVPCGGNRLTMKYTWDAANYRFVLEATEGADYVTINNNIKYVKNRNMNNTSFTYTSPSTGNGSATKYLYGSSITTANRTVTVNIGSVGSVTTTVDATYGKKLIKASDLESAITALLDENGYNSADFDFTQMAYTEFTYKGCSNVNFAFNGSIATPEPTAAPTAAPTTAPTTAPTEEPTETPDCRLKVWASTPGSEEGSPTYNDPYTTMIVSGTGYTWLSPEQYGIILSEGYELDYYYDNAERHIGSTSYIASNLSGWSAVAYFKQKTITNKEVTVEYRTEAGDLKAVATTTVSGDYWTDVVINGADLFNGTAAAQQGFEIVGASTMTVKPGKVGSTVVFTVAKPEAEAPRLVVEGVTVALEEGFEDRISLMAIAQGSFTSYQDMRADSSFKGITTAKQYTARELEVATLFTVYMRTTDGTAYFVEVTLIPTVPVVSTNASGAITVVANASEVAKMWVCIGNYDSYDAMKADQATNGYRNVSTTLEYAPIVSTEMVEYTCYIVMADSSRYLRHIDVDTTIAVTNNMIEISLGEELVKRALICHGAYETYTEMSANSPVNITSTLEYAPIASTQEETYTFYVTYNGTTNVTIGQITVPATTDTVPDIVWDGMKFSLKNGCEDNVKYVRSAKGEYDSLTEMRAEQDTNEMSSKKTRTFTGITEPTMITVIIVDIDNNQIVKHHELVPVASVELNGTTISAIGAEDDIRGMYIAMGHFTDYAALKAHETYTYVRPGETFEVTEAGEWTVRLVTYDGNITWYYFNVA